MGYTWDRSARVYKTRQPILGTNARLVEDIEDDEDEEGEEEEANNEVHSQPMENDHQVTDHGDWLGPTPGQHSFVNQGWGESKHT